MTVEELTNNLAGLAGDLDLAIQQAVEDPLSFHSHPQWRFMEDRCRLLHEAACLSKISCTKNESHRLAETIWAIRARLGRLHRLLDSSSVFFSTCFSATQGVGLAYGVHGEWGAPATNGHLAVDC